jgi:transposase-like protein
MMTLFDDEYILKAYVEEEKREAAKQATEQTEIKTKQQTALRMADMGTAIDVIAKVLDVSISLVKEWLEGSMTTAK